MHWWKMQNIMPIEIWKLAYMVLAEKDCVCEFKYLAVTNTWVIILRDSS